MNNPEKIEPTTKSQSIDGLLGAIMGKNRKDTINNHLCMTCDGVAESFRDEISRREYAISGMCQQCQDGFFDKS